MLMCACSLYTTCLNIFFLIRLRLRVSGWLALGVACLPLFVEGLIQLLHGPLLPRCLVVLVRCLCHLFDFSSLFI